MASSSDILLGDSQANILLVDDQPANLLALEAILADLGQILVRASSGEEALRHVLRQDFAAILLDVQMQGLDGLETARLIRGRKQSRHTPILFLTAYDTPTARVTEAYRLGGVDFLVKPLVPDILRAKVTVFVELARKAAQIERQGVRLREMERREYEHRLAEKAREQEERFSLIAENVQDYAIFMLDPAGNVRSWNAGAERILGYRSEEVLGGGASRFFTPEDATAGRPERELREAEATGRATNDCWLVRKGGNRFWASGVTTALHDGELRGFIKILRDLTERKTLEDELRQRAEALSRANQHKDEFLAMLAHELRNPLAPLLTSLHVLRQPGTEEDMRERSLERVERQVRHLSRLVEDLLDVSRILRGKEVIRAERVDLGRLVRTTSEDRRSLLEEAGLTLVVEAPPTPVWVQGDVVRLAQCLNNLLDNAAKFTDRGGHVTVKLTMEEGQQTVLTVADTGPGIDPGVLPRLFEPFAQAEQGLDRSRGGLGLGLAVVKGLVELHGGAVRAASAGLGAGTVFEVRLPMDPEPPALTAVSARQGTALKRSKVLVIEDNKDAADSLRMLLELFGHEARVAYAGPAGVEGAAAWLPDVVVSDIGLPGFDGYEVARRLRQTPGLERALLVALTGYGGDEDRRRSREAGFDHHLVKPADPDDLLRVLTTTPA